MPYYLSVGSEAEFFTDPVNVDGISEMLRKWKKKDTNLWNWVSIKRERNALVLPMQGCLVMAWEDDASRDQLIADLQEQWRDETGVGANNITLPPMDPKFRMLCATLYLNQQFIKVDRNDVSTTDRVRSQVVACRRWVPTSRLPLAWRALASYEQSTRSVSLEDIGNIELGWNENQLPPKQLV